MGNHNCALYCSKCYDRYGVKYTTYRYQGSGYCRVCDPNGNKHAPHYNCRAEEADREEQREKLRREQRDFEERINRMKERYTPKPVKKEELMTKKIQPIFDTNNENPYNIFQKTSIKSTLRNLSSSAETFGSMGDDFQKTLDTVEETFKNTRIPRDLYNQHLNDYKKYSENLKDIRKEFKKDLDKLNNAIQKNTDFDIAELSDEDFDDDTKLSLSQKLNEIQKCIDNSKKRFQMGLDNMKTIQNDYKLFLKFIREGVKDNKNKMLQENQGILDTLRSLRDQWSKMPSEINLAFNVSEKSTSGGFLGAILGGIGGAIIGGLVGGPLGVIAGAIGGGIVGHMFDKKSKTKKTQNIEKVDTNKIAQKFHNLLLGLEQVSKHNKIELEGFEKIINFDEDEFKKDNTNNEEVQNEMEKMMLEFEKTSTTLQNLSKQLTEGKDTLDLTEFKKMQQKIEKKLQILSKKITRLHNETIKI